MVFNIGERRSELKHVVGFKRKWQKTTKGRPKGKTQTPCQWTTHRRNNDMMRISGLSNLDKQHQVTDWVMSQVPIKMRGQETAFRDNGKWVAPGNGQRMVSALILDSICVAFSTEFLS